MRDEACQPARSSTWPRRLLFALLSLPFTAGTGHAALCGDSGGDGYLTAADALATLKFAVGSGGDRRGDVVPAGGDGLLQASDALKILQSAVAGEVPHCRGATATRAVVSTSDPFFSSGGFAVVDIATRGFHFRGGSIQDDSVVRAPAGLPLVINRKDFNTLQVLDTEVASLPNVKECSVSDGYDSNPQDVLFTSATKGYVTPAGDPNKGKGKNLLVIDPRIVLDPDLDPACSGLITKRIDLSSFDSDGLPEMDQMALIGNDLFVSLQLLDTGLQPKGPSAVAVIDTVTDTIKGSIPLSFANPFAATKGIPYDEFQGLLFLGGPGKTGLDFDDGGIEAIDPITMTSAGMLLTGEDIDANLYDFVIVGTKRAFAIIANAKTNSVVDINLDTREVKVVLVSCFPITDIEMTERGELWVAYRGEGETKADECPKECPEECPPGYPAGLRIFNVATGTELTVDGQEGKPKPIALGQAPFTLAFID